MIQSVHTFLLNFSSWYQRGNRWWLPFFVGACWCLCHPPFNHETSPFFTVFPLLSFFVYIPLFVFAREKSLKTAFFKTYFFGIAASLSQFYWLANVVVEGVWLMIMLGLLLLTLLIAFVYVAYGMLFRIIWRTCGRWSLLIFPSAWILIEYLRGIGDMSFPWESCGYALTPLLPLAQAASVVGVYGLSFLVICGNVIVWEFLRAIYMQKHVRLSGISVIAICVCVVVLSIWGSLRLHRHSVFSEKFRISLIQNNIDQAHWEPQASLDTSMAVTESLVYAAALEHPSLMVFPESGVYCYLDRNYARRQQVLAWAESTDVSMLLGTLHFERMGDNPYYKYRVYNAVFYLGKDAREFQRYYKINLVPFSEALPFEGSFPILSRINLGESDFARGTEEKIFSITDKIRAAPFICYEIIYPDFVRRRVKAGATMLVNVTNDGWFGRSNAAYHHAAMARMRCIENGVSLARCANSGISMLVDPCGRIIKKTALYQRVVCTGDVPVNKIPTLYTKYGDVMLVFSLLCCVAGLVCGVVFLLKRKV